MDIQEFIKSASSQVGISDDVAGNATGSILGLLKDKADPADFSELLGKMPGAESLMGAQSEKSGGLGGLLGGASSLMSGALGGKLGGAASVMGAFQKSGLSTAQVGQFLSLFANFAKGEAGAGLIDRILGKVPELKSMID